MNQGPFKLEYGVQPGNQPPPPAPWTLWQKAHLLTLIAATVIFLFAGVIYFIRWLGMAMS